LNVLEKTKTIYTLWQKKYVGNPEYLMAESTFRKMVPKWFKDPLRKTDMCHICAKLPQLGKELNRNDINDTRQAEILEEISEIKEHRLQKERQRAQFKKDKTSLKEGEALIEMDFKENVHLGDGPVQLGRDFYQTPHRAVFGVVMWYVDNGQLVRQDIDYISECLNKDAQYVCDVLDDLRKHEHWTSKNINSVYIWTDNCGSHFKTKELIFYLSKWKVDDGLEVVPNLNQFLTFAVKL
jgi:hypothetical protein